MEVVSCYCVRCKEKLGRFNNCWNAIGSYYYSPADLSYTILGTLGMKATGDIKPAATGTKIEKSFTQDLACSKCEKLVGIRCDNAPAGHMLKRDQLILKSKSMSVISESTGEKATINVLKIFPITGPPPEPPRNVTRGDIAAGGYGEFAKFADWTEDAITNQRNDIDRIEGTVVRIERDMRSFKEFMSDVRKEMATLRRSSNSALNQDVASIREEMKELRLQVEGNQHKAAKLTTQEYDVLAQDMVKIDQKASEVGGLKMELNYLRTRLKRFEETTQGVVSQGSRHAESGIDQQSTSDPNRATAASRLAPDPTNLGRPKPAEHEVVQSNNFRRAAKDQQSPGEPTRAGAASRLAQEIERSGRQGINSSQQAEATTEQPLQGGSTRTQAALHLAQELARNGQQKAAARITDRYTLGKRKADDTEVNPPQPPTAAKKGRLEDNGNRSNAGIGKALTTENRHKPSAGQAKPLDIESSPVPGGNGEDLDEMMEDYHSVPAKRSFGRPRKSQFVYSERRRDSDGVLLTESGKIDGRSLRRKKSNAGGSELNAAHPRRKSAPMVIAIDDDDDDDDEDNIERSTRKVLHPSARHGSVLPSIELEDRKEEARRRKMEARDALVRETLHHFA